MEPEAPQHSTLVNFGSDHPRLTLEGKQLLGSIVFILVLVVLAVGFWKQIQAQRRPKKRPGRRSERVNLMDSLASRDRSDRRDDTGGDKQP
jgi:hypothetical protein